MNKVTQTKQGFTLVELLVVMSIIAMLLSILLPVLGRIRAQAKTAICSSSQHQIGLALGGYMADYGGAFPPELAYPWLSRTEIANWGAGISWQHCLVNPANPRACVTGHSGNRSLVGLRCPNWPKALGGFAADFSATGGYALNDNLDGVFSWQFIPGADPYKLKPQYIAANIAKVRRPGSKLCILETTGAEDPLNPGRIGQAKDTVESWGYLASGSAGQGQTIYTYRGWLRIDHGQYAVTGPFTMKNLKALPKNVMMKQKLNSLFIDQHAETLTLKRIADDSKMWLPYN